MPQPIFKIDKFMPTCSGGGSWRVGRPPTWWWWPRARGRGRSSRPPASCTDARSAPPPRSRGPWAGSWSCAGRSWLCVQLGEVGEATQATCWMYQLRKDVMWIFGFVMLKVKFGWKNHVWILYIHIYKFALSPSARMSVFLQRRRGRGGEGEKGEKVKRKKNNESLLTNNDC